MFSSARKRINPELRVVRAEPERPPEVREFEDLIADAVRNKGRKFRGPERDLIRTIHRDNHEAWGIALASLGDGSKELRRELERLTSPPSADVETEKRPKGEVVLQQILEQDCDLFRTTDVHAYADIMVKGHRETGPIRSTYFEKWLQYSFFKKMNSIPDERLFKRALAQAEMSALMGEDVQEREVFLRVASIKRGTPRETMYVDLCDKDWRVIEIDQKGWHVIQAHELPEEVRFRRAPLMRHLPEPVRGGSLKTLRMFLNFKTDDDYNLMVGSLLNFYRRTKIYPILSIHGEEGSAKTSALRVIRDLSDPTEVGERALPKNEHDLYIYAEGSHVVSFDNLTGIPPWLSDAFCRLSTGGGYASRKLYTGRDEETFKASRPIMILGIPDLINRPDLASRAMRVELKPIEAEVWKAPDAFDASFREEQPKILGALMDALALGLRELPHVKLERNVRMAGVMLWATACQDAFIGNSTYGRHPKQSFYQSYQKSQDAMRAEIKTGDSVIMVIERYIEARSSLEGQTEEIRGDLKAFLEKQDGSVPKDFPATPRAFGPRLKTATKTLRESGILVHEVGKGRNGSPIYLIERK